MSLQAPAPIRTLGEIQSDIEKETHLVEVHFDRARACVQRGEEAQGRRAQLERELEAAYKEMELK